MVAVALLGLVLGLHPQGAKGATLLAGGGERRSLSIYMVFRQRGLRARAAAARPCSCPRGSGSTVVLLLPWPPDRPRFFSPRRAGRNSAGGTARAVRVVGRNGGSNRVGAVGSLGIVIVLRA